MKINKFWLFLLFSVLGGTGFADERIRVVRYIPNQVTEINTSPGFATTIEFGNETIKAVAIGDTANWQATPYENKVFIKPAEGLSAKVTKSTNLMVATNKHDYYFLVRLLAGGNPTFILRFDYRPAPPPVKNTRPVPVTGSYDYGSPRDNAPTPRPKTTSAVPAASGVKRVNPALPPHPVSKNSLTAEKVLPRSYYKITKNSKIAVNQIYDDGRQTYFVFAKNQVVPAIYAVTAEGREIKLPVRMIAKNFAAVSRTGSRFTLRTQGYVACILKDYSLIPPPRGKAAKNKIKKRK